MVEFGKKVNDAILEAVKDISFHREIRITEDYLAYVGQNGHLAVLAPSEKHRKAAIKAISRKGIVIERYHPQRPRISGHHRSEEVTLRSGILMRDSNAMPRTVKIVPGRITDDICNFQGGIDEYGKLAIQAASERCEKAAVEAVSKGVDVTLFRGWDNPED